MCAMFSIRTSSKHSETNDLHSLTLEQGSTDVVDRTEVVHRSRAGCSAEVISTQDLAFVYSALCTVLLRTVQLALVVYLRALHLRARCVHARGKQ